MVLNYIWVAFFVIAFIVALCKLIFMGDVEIFTELVNSTFSSSKTAFEISLGLTGILALWLGVMKIGENSGMINALSRWLSPVFCRLFPRNTKRTSCHGLHFHESLCQHAGAGQCRYSDGTESHEGTPGTEPEKGHRHQSDGHVPCPQHLGTDTYPRQHHDVSLADGCRPTHGHLYPHTDNDRHLDHCRCHCRQHCTTHQPVEQAHTYPDWLHQPFLCRTHLSVYTD